MHFKLFWTIQKENQIKYWLIKIVNFKNTHFKKCLKNNNIKIYSTYCEGNSVVAERFIRTLKK